MSKNETFWSKSPIGHVQSSQEFYLKSYERAFLLKCTKDGLNPKVAAIFGCGNGREIPGMLEILKVERLHSYDISPKLLNECRENMSKLGIETPIEYYERDFAKPGLEFPTIDVAYVSNGVLSYILPEKAQDVFLGKVRESMNDNAYMVVEVPCLLGGSLFRKASQFLYGVSNIVFKGRSFGMKRVVSGKYVNHYMKFTKDTLKRKLENNGFKVAEITTMEEFRGSNQRYNTVIALCRKAQ